MINILRRLSGSFFLWIFPGLLIAQEIDSLLILDSLPTFTLSEVVITANRYGSLQYKTPEAIRILDSKPIRDFQIRTAPEALLMTPGVFVQKTNHGGGSPFLRGLTGNQTLLLIDGIRLSNATARYGPNQYFNTIDVFCLQKIEVLRGSGSVQYGSDALGGTIQAFSRELKYSDESTWQSSLVSRFATHGMEQSLHGDLKYMNSKAAFRGGVTWRNFGDIVGGDTTGRQTPSGYREFDFDLKARILLSPSSYVIFAYQNVHQGDVPVYHKIVLEDYAINKMDPQDRELAYLRYNHKFDTGILESMVLTSSYQFSEEGREQQKNRSSILRIENDRVYSYSFTAEAVTSTGNVWSANSGLEIYSDLVNSTRKDTDLSNNESVEKRGLYPDGATLTSMAAFSIHTFDFEKWNISAGARFNSYLIKVSDGEEGITKIRPSALVWNIALLRKLDEKNVLFGSVNTGFRVPNINDLGSLGVVDFRYEIPNFDLSPEHSIQYQAGYKKEGRSLVGEIYIYRNDLYDLIVRNSVPGDSIEGYPVYLKENVERAYIHGIETAWKFNLNYSWQFSGSLTYTFGQNITRNEPVRRIPPLFGRIAVDYKFNKWSLNLEWQGAGKQDRLAPGDIEDNRIPDGGTPAWNIFNIYAGYSWKFIMLDFSFLNIFNQDYRFHGSGVNGYGRSAFMSVTVNI